jgi:hypothetical protein
MNRHLNYKRQKYKVGHIYGEGTSWRREVNEEGKESEYG